jgi:hypothetical protein
MNAHSELAKAFAELTIPVEQPIEYRLYYDERGYGTFMSGASGPHGNYILIPKDIYDRAVTHNLRVVNGKLTVIDASAGIKLQLIKSTSGQRVVKNHPAIPLRDTEQYTDIEYYDRNR